MTKQKQIYKCNVCGNIVEVLHAADGELVCCGQSMELFQEKSKDEGQEKHVPIIEKTGKGIKVKVGSVPHPMTSDHYIEWIEVVVDGQSCRKFLQPGSEAEAEFEISASNVEARAYCNIHGLWKNS